MDYLHKRLQIDQLFNIKIKLQRYIQSMYMFGYSFKPFPSQTVQNQPLGFPAIWLAPTRLAF